jgi:hypothetical protein
LVSRTEKSRGDSEKLSVFSKNSLKFEKQHFLHPALPSAQPTARHRAAYEIQKNALDSFRPHVHNARLFTIAVSEFYRL